MIQVFDEFEACPRPPPTPRVLLSSFSHDGSDRDFSGPSPRDFSATWAATSNDINLSCNGQQPQQQQQQQQHETAGNRERRLLESAISLASRPQKLLESSPLTSSTTGNTADRQMSPDAKGSSRRPLCYWARRLRRFFLSVSELKCVPERDEHSLETLLLVSPVTFATASVLGTPRRPTPSPSRERRKLSLLRPPRSVATAGGVVELKDGTWGGVGCVEVGEG